MIGVRTATGRIVDLVALPADLDIVTEVGEPLARIKRFAGQVPDCEYSVAEHCCRGADAIQAELIGNDFASPRAALAALYFLLHEEESFSGDVIRPFVDLVVASADTDPLRPWLHAGGLVRAAISKAKAHLCRQIHEAAGLPWPPPLWIAGRVGAMDNRMLAEEQRHLWPDGVEPDPAVAQLAPVSIPDWRSPVIRPWSWQRAAAEWTSRWHSLRVAAGIVSPRGTAPSLPLEGRPKAAQPASGGGEGTAPAEVPFDG